MEINEMIALVKEIGAFKPLVREVIDGLKEYEDEYRELSNFIIDETVNSRSKLFSDFVNKGFSREEAMTLTLASIQELTAALKAVKK